MIEDEIANSSETEILNIDSPTDLDRELPECIAVADSYSSATHKTILAALPGYLRPPI